MSFTTDKDVATSVGSGVWRCGVPRQVTEDKQMGRGGVERGQRIRLHELHNRQGYDPERSSVLRRSTEDTRLERGHRVRLHELHHRQGCGTEPFSETIRGAEGPERGYDQVALIKATPRSFSPSHRLGGGLNIYVKL